MLSQSGAAIGSHPGAAIGATPGWGVSGFLASIDDRRVLWRGQQIVPQGGAMAGRRSPVTDVRELVRRLRMGEPDRRIARDLGMSRNTVGRYRAWAESRGLLTGELPPLDALMRRLPPADRSARPPHEQSQVEPFREQVQALRQRGVQGQAIWQILVDQHGFTGSYSAIKRFLRRLSPPRDGATVRLEVAPGDEADSPASSSIPRRTECGGRGCS